MHSHRDDSLALSHVGHASALQNACALLVAAADEIPSPASIVELSRRCEDSNTDEQLTPKDTALLPGVSTPTLSLREAKLLHHFVEWCTLWRTLRYSSSGIYIVLESSYIAGSAHVPFKRFTGEAGGDGGVNLSLARCLSESGECDNTL